MEKEKGKLKEILNVALRLFVICFAATLILALVNFLTKDTIVLNNEKAFSEGCENVMPDAKTFERVDLSSYGEGTEGALAYGEDGKVMGICIKRSVTGYSSGLVVMAGIDKDLKTLTGIKILEHSETPGLGAVATEENFTDQFKGKTHPLATEKEGGEIVAITGATKTTNGVVKEGVNEAFRIANQYFAEEGIK